MLSVRAKRHWKHVEFQIYRIHDIFMPDLFGSILPLHYDLRPNQLFSSVRHSSLIYLLFVLLPPLLLPSLHVLDALLFPAFFHLGELPEALHYFLPVFFFFPSFLARSGLAFILLSSFFLLFFLSPFSFYSDLSFFCWVFSFYFFLFPSHYLLHLLLYLFLKDMQLSIHSQSSSLAFSHFFLSIDRNCSFVAVCLCSYLSVYRNIYFSSFVLFYSFTWLSVHIDLSTSARFLFDISCRQLLA